MEGLVLLYAVVLHWLSPLGPRYRGMQMRPFLPTLIAILLLTDHAPAQQRAGVGCVDSRFFFVRNGITTVAAHTRTGQPCQIGFGARRADFSEGGSDIDALQIVTRPQNGVLGASSKEEHRRYVAYMPRAGFVGQDHFELFIRFVPAGGGAYTTQIKVNMNVTP
jgi:hypothetical protein